MKKTTLLILFLSFCTNVFAQDEILYQFPWRLYQFTYDGQEYSAPNDPDFDHFLIFTDSDPDTMVTFVTENEVEAEVVFEGDGYGTFTTSNVSITDFECELYCEFENDYLSFFFNEGNPKTFTWYYDFIDFPEGYILYVVDDDGNEAIYYDTLSLNTQEMLLQKTAVYPNPVSNTLFVLNPMSTVVDLNVYNLQGQRVFNQQHIKNSIDVSAFSPGVYFFEFSSGNQKKIQKVIKK